MSRLVVVLGREADVDMEDMVQRARKERADLVILSLGFPLSREQNRAIDVAMEAAGRGLLDLEARITYTVDQAAHRIRADDRVVIAVFGRDRKQLERALRRRSGPQQDDAPYRSFRAIT